MDIDGRRMRTSLALLFLLAIPGASLAQDAEPPAKRDAAPARSDKAADDDILVIGDRQGEAKAVRDQTAVVTKRGPSDKPLPRFYQPFCPMALGVQADYAAYLTERIRSNAREAGVLVAKGKCQPNALLIFAKDARKTLKALRKEQPWFFTDMPESDVNRLIERNEQTFAWQISEVRGVDGKPMRTIEVEIGMPPIRRELTVNDQWQTGRLNQPIRVDLSGSVLMIDDRYLPGKSLAQLADYASLRLLASTNDIPPDELAFIPTILSLFTAPDSAPPGMSSFDTGYLRARYSLRPNANPLAIKDATVKAYSQETGK